ncbi:MAG: M24 family metallopeptidase [Nitrososphaerota archaeon]|nr:M24 family metallopeptidase [Nitrososphaerota archaeon]
MSSAVPCSLNYKKRSENLRKSVNSSVDCVLISSLPNLKYFFDYRGESYERFCCGLISTKKEKSALIVPKLDEAKAEKGAADSVYPWTDSEGYKTAFLRALSDLGVHGGRFGCEDSLTFGSMQSIRKISSSRFESASSAISEIRQIKDEEERIALKQSAGILRRVYKDIDKFLKIGAREIDIALTIKNALREYGATNADFCAVQSGPNGAIPHQDTSSKKVKRGDFVVVDISITGPTGYFADFTRTFSIGTPSKLQQQIYEVVKRAQSSAIQKANANAEAGEVDAAARGVIDESGYGKYFFHRTGHGIGLEVHEAPWIREGNKMKLRSGMAFTVEPGIYLPQKFGVRIEDNLLVEDSGTTNLTGLDHELVEL